eukprot:CAMPEP_0117744442 /NCGR_PEP_ID=MMETSP0947-20121206/6758_1 /TAXON_ID=44440 /ORGANISM="Chattonella subsalsa, Strain CCMP2191" /LENGTH=290 /DNA_ID=CAMNT_0005561385 /DNA_START=175 /DNA_END=1047 /DNA_ORIENTATION=+
MARNWFCSLEKIGLSEGSVIIDLSSKNLCRWLQPSAQCLKVSVEGFTSTFALVGTEKYGELLKIRTQIIIDIIEQTRSSLVFSDVDVFFIKNPVPYLQEISKNKDILFQGDSIRNQAVDPVLRKGGLYACAGFTYVNRMGPSFSDNKNASLNLYQSILSFQKNFHYNDQWGLNVCLRHPAIALDLEWGILDYDLFMNGYDYFMRRRSSSSQQPDPFLVHSNHLLGAQKWVEMIDKGLWCDQGNLKFICQNSLTGYCKKKENTHAYCVKAAQFCKAYDIDIFSQNAFPLPQ